jgi:hypothetical protein
MESNSNKMTSEQPINNLITNLAQKRAIDTNQISDGYHTFGELYEHRIVLWMALCRLCSELGDNVWKSKLHSDGSSFDGWFVLGITNNLGQQMTYHLPNEYWDQCDFNVLDKSPEFDGHSSKDVLERIQNLYNK